MIGLDAEPLALYLDESDDEVVLSADMPHVKKEDIKIDYRGGRLDIRGRRGNVECVASCNLSGVDVSKAAATLRDGVLTVKIPRSAEMRPVRIKVA